MDPLHEPEEEWKPIDGYDSYQVSNYGNVKNSKDKLMKLFSERGEDYLKVALQRNSKKKKYYVARLVACAFIPNPENKSEVNHLNTKTDNRAWMLEWTTRIENMKHAHINIIKYANVAVVATDKDGKIIEFNSVDTAAAFVNGVKSGISICCAGRMPTYKGYKWTYVVSKQAQDNEGEEWRNTSNSIYPEINQYNYYVSNLGRVKNIRGNLLKPGQKDKVCFSRKNTVAKFFGIHRLVLMTFNILNPDNKPEVDHIDGNWRNNKLDNLRWVTGKENCNNHNSLRSTTVKGTSLLTGEFKIYKAIKDTVVDGFKDYSVSECINGHRKVHKNYMWEKITIDV